MSHLNNRPVRWQRSSTYNHPFLFVIPSVRWAFGPPKVMKNFTGNYFLWSRFHFLVIPTGAKRSGGTCGSADPSMRCFSTERRRPVPACRGGICGAPRPLPDSQGQPNESRKGRDYTRPISLVGGSTLTPNLISQSGLQQQFVQ